MSTFYPMIKSRQNPFVFTLFCFSFILSVIHSPLLTGQCVTNAYTGNAASGNQSYTERLGLQFTSSAMIKITHLGAFDDDGDGLNLPITVGIVRNSDAITVVGTEVFSGIADPLIGNYRIRAIPPVYLPAGTYTIVAVGYGATEQNGNSNIGGHPTVSTNAGGLLSFDNALFGGVGFGLPTTFFATPGAFHAGTFTFEPALSAPIITKIPNVTFSCQGDILSVNIFAPGNGGNIDCEDQFRFSTDNGANWSSWGNVVPSFNGVIGTNIVQARRSCDSDICLSDTSFVSWIVIGPQASILPDPAEVCAGADIILDGNPQGGAPPYTTHNWSGAGAAFAFPLDEQNTVFNTAIPGSYTIRYTVTDFSGCTGSDELTVTVHANPVADILPSSVADFICPGKNLLLNGNPSGGDGNYQHLWADAANFNDPNIQSPVFNTLILGDYMVTYTVTDGNDCSGTDSITFTVGDEVEPEITCPDNIVTGTDLDLCSAVVNYDISFSDNCSGLDIVGFEDEFETSNWTLTNDNGGNGTVDESLAPSSITLTGADFGPSLGPPNNTDYCITIPGTTSGMLTFDWSYTSFDVGGPDYDDFGYVINGVYTKLTDDAGPINQMGTVNVALSPGQQFCFRIFSFDSGYGPAVTITMNFGYMENINPMLNQTAGLPSGSIFPLGTTTNTFEVTDFAGNTNSCSFNVTVEDRQNPTINCPDNIVEQLDPLECGRVVLFEVTADDNCAVDRIIYTGGLISGALFPIGITTVSLTAYDESENSASCSFTVDVRDYQHPPLGCIPVHLSLDEQCSAVLTLENVLTGYLSPDGDVLLGCLDCFKINIKSPHGVDLGDIVDGTYLGKTLEYMVVNTKSGFSCWNTVLIEDKIKPTIQCSNDTISCMAELSTAKTPLVFDNCHAKLVKLNEYHEKIDCDELFIGRYVRTWKAIDDYGNESEPCNDTVYLRRTDLTGLVFPGDITLSCSSGFATDTKGFPYPAPSVAGVPTLNGVNLYPFDKSLICNGAVHYNDQLFLNTACKKMILRTWAITEWWCSTTVTYNMPPQIITIVDDEAPIIPKPADITITTKSRACEADVLLPVLNITDNCNALKIVYINVTLDGVPAGYLESNGGLMTLGVGKHKIEYTAFDICGNSSSEYYYVTVQDDTPPIAICDHLNVVSLNNHGHAKATAIAVDNGSFDECGPVELKIQRMEDPCGNGFDIGWHDAVEFCCEDAGLTRMVILLVTDAGGRTNMCMVSIQVQDKIPPVITCPPHLTVEDCTATFDPNNAGAVFGNPEIFDNCPANNTIREVLTDGRNNCGIGIVTRQFTIVSNGTVFGSCTQTIEFINIDPFDANNPAHVKWPKDTMLNSICSPLNLLPESLGDNHGFPVIIEDACDLVGMNYHDHIFYFANNNACFKILRKWSIIDWCQKNSDGTFKIWTWEQEIKVVDNTAPEITSGTADRVQCTYDSECQSGAISGLIATAMDCTPDSMLQWTFRIYNIDVLPQVLYAAGNGNDVSGTYPVGKYRVEFEVLDRCGNISTTGFNFEIRNCKAPTAICKVGLATSLTMMDTDSDGTPDTPLAMIKAEFFNNKKSYHPCNYSMKISYSADVNDTLRTFNCDSIGNRTIHMWVTDINGNTSFCTTFISVQDSMDLCGTPRIEVRGTIKTDDQKVVENVTVNFNNGEGSPSMTDHNGQYKFEGLQPGGSYLFAPFKDGDDKNGITTLDIVMIQRHILGIQKLNSPYRMLAADINNSGNISASDLLELRKLILGLYDQLPSSNSWKFIDGMYQFPDPSDPWLGFAPEQCLVSNILQSSIVDFVAIKMGDVNGSADGHQFTGDILEHRSNFQLWLDAENLSSDNILRVPVVAGSNDKIYGMQMVLQFNDVSEINVVPSTIRFSSQEVVKINHNKLGISISIPEGIRVKEGDILFYIDLKNPKLSDKQNLIKVNSDINPEIYTEGLFEQQLSLNWRNKTIQPFIVENVQPNPWKEKTVIQVQMPENAVVSFKIKDMSGRKVVSRIENLAQGTNQIFVTADELGKAGVYIYEIKYENQSITGKMILIE